MKYKCLICREPKSLWTRASLPGKQFGTTFIDTETDETYTLCPKCAYKLIKTGCKWKDLLSIGVQQTIKNWVEQGSLSFSDLQLIQSDSAEIISQKYFKKSSPSGFLWINNKYIIFDEPSRKILIDHHILNFSDIKEYKILDHSIEYDMLSPSTTLYNTKSKHGLSRTVVGGILAGPAGAIMGGVTAKHSLQVTKGSTSSYTTTEHDFIVIIRLNTLLNGGAIAAKVGKSEEELLLLTNLLDNIIKLQ